MADDVKQPADTAKNDAPVTPSETSFTAPKEDPVQGIRNAAEVTPAVDLKATAPSADVSTATATVEEKKADPVTPPAATTTTTPAEEKKADAPVNTAPPVEEKKETKEGDAPAAPVAETEEEIRKKKEAEAAANKPQQQQQTPPAADDNKINDEQLQQSKFATNLKVDPKSLKILHETWPNENFQMVEDFANVLRDGEKSIYAHKGGLVFELSNNHAIEWHANLGGAEFIGMPNRSKKFDEIDAHGVMAAARQRGWKSVNVYGNDAQKDMMYLAATRQGLGVANYAPTPGSAADLEAQKIKAAMQGPKADDLLLGISNAPVDVSKFADLTATDKKPDAETPKQEAPKQETTAATPPAETVKTEAPKALDGLEGFLDKKIEAAKGDPELQKGITALRDGIKSGAIAVDETSAGMIRSSLGKDDTTPSEPKKYAEIEGFLRTADKANDGLKLPAVTIAAAKETPAAIVPKEAKPAKNAVAPA